MRASSPMDSYRPIRGLLRSTLVDGSPHQPRPLSFYKGRARLGINHEILMLRHCQSLYGDASDSHSGRISFLASPWFCYEEATRGGYHYCQPDGLLFLWDRGLIVILEAKLSHCEQAFHQLTRYSPIVQKAFGGPSLWRTALCEVVCWYDAAVKLPVTPVLIKHLHDASPSGFNIKILRKDSP
jgi:hypothetical protein